MPFLKKYIAFAKQRFAAPELSPEASDAIAGGCARLSATWVARCRAGGRCVSRTIGYMSGPQPSLLVVGLAATLDSCTGLWGGLQDASVTPHPIWPSSLNLPTGPCPAPSPPAEYYADLRNSQEVKALPVTVRTLETIIRLSSAHAKVGTSCWVQLLGTT